MFYIIVLTPTKVRKFFNRLFISLKFPTFATLNN